MLSPQHLVGRRIGPYQVERPIGHGALAWVFVARSPDDATPVALKLLKPAYATDRRFAQRFLADAHAVSHLRHPNIVAILDVAREDAHAYFTMPWYRDSLAARVASGGMVYEHAAVRIARDVADALVFAHEAGWVHGDIKPANILLDAAGSGIVADLGINRAVPDYLAASGTDMTVGTPQYMSPEHAQGRPVDGRSDLYALGMSLYRATTGALPFQATDWYELARMHVKTTPARPRTRQPSLSPAFDRLVMRCLAKHPDDRFASAAELRAALDRLGRDHPQPGSR